jgi:hypothetical protein
MAKGKTRWYPSHINPVRKGMYECLMRSSRSLPMFRVYFLWDDEMFVTGWPLSVVVYWRGQTKAAAHQPKKGK